MTVDLQQVIFQGSVGKHKEMKHDKAVDLQECIEAEGIKVF